MRKQKFEIKSGDETKIIETEWYVPTAETPERKRKSVRISGLKSNVNEDYLEDILADKFPHLGEIQNITFNKKKTSALVRCDSTKGRCYLIVCNENIFFQNHIL